MTSVLLTYEQDALKPIDPKSSADVYITPRIVEPLLALSPDPPEKVLLILRRPSIMWVIASPVASPRMFQMVGWSTGDPETSIRPFGRRGLDVFNTKMIPFLLNAGRNRFFVALFQRCY
jgi:hypothetical protein